MAQSALQIPDSLSQAAVAAWGRYGAWLPTLAAAVLAIVLGRLLADLLWSFVPVPEGARWTPAPAAAAQDAATDVPVDVGRIVAAHLFGEQAAELPVQTELLEAPETALSLTLMGVLADEVDESASRALIAEQNGDERHYAIGDDVARGVQLQAIFPDRVILSRNGRLETLRLERDAPSRVSATSRRTAEPEPEEEAAPAQQLSAIREQVLAEPSKAAEYIRIQPANLGGQLKGYRVYPGRDRSVFSMSGLRPGDLVTGVNGVQLDDPAKALQLLTDLSQASQLTLEVQRGGDTRTLDISFN